MTLSPHARSTAAATQRGHHHDGAERHHHTADIALDGVFAVAEPEPGVDSGAFALTAALALMALASWRASGRATRPVWRPAPAWAWQTSIPATPRKPPRPA